MARSHGRFAQLYVAITSAGAASPLLHTAQTSINLATDKTDVTAFGDTTKQWVAGLADGQGTFSGFATDTTSTALITAALDGVARRWYFYPFAATTIYLYGTGFFDWQTESSVGDAVKMSGSFSAATPVTPIGF